MSESKNEFFKEIKEEFKEFGAKVNKMFEDLVSKGEESGEFHLAVDVVETNEAYVFSADLPGMTKADVSLQVRERQLVLKGVRKREGVLGDEVYHKKERSFGTFRRSFSIPDGVDYDSVGAKFDNGVLTITFPKDTVVEVDETEIEID